jgi:hypothetical protein
VPVELDAPIRRCLRKDPDRRLQHMGDARILLEEIRDGGTPKSGGAAVPAPRPRNRAARALLLASLGAVAVVAALAIQAVVRNAHSVDLGSYTITPFAATLPVQSAPEWSPDGKTIAFLEAEGNYQANLYVQGLDAVAPAQITHAPFTVFAWYRPFWSPDSRFLYFTVWNSKHGYANGIWRVSAAGGEPVLVQPDAATGAISPGRPHAGNVRSQGGRRGSRSHLDRHAARGTAADL